jgi:hypothetical protein
MTHAYLRRAHRLGQQVLAKPSSSGDRNSRRVIHSLGDLDAIAAAEPYRAPSADKEREK